MQARFLIKDLVNNITKHRILIVCCLIVFNYINNNKKKEGKRHEMVDERNENDKAEIIEKFEGLTRNDFRTWLSNQNTWRNDLKNEAISAIRGAIALYIDHHSIMFCIFNNFCFFI
ncbi:hypothetical protein RFI_20958 [Reticulomyxa filosa]|uniref:Uncharacterized protein n=1 Tax=Reticulomyxa filosa TaxID=46433 RepID=X6MRY6_RETFI|nr:hypothetical protein RFI_20958 [Reticulomyxa filosa]|eukprot:ETO16391.1 hypothetical protein RFI_20958 [Reticulomyxa filosa]